MHGINLIIALAEGLIEALPILIEKAPVIIEKLASAFIRNFPKIVKVGGELIGKLAMGILGSIAKLIQVAPKLISALVNGLTQGFSQVANVGKYLIEGLWSGISGMADWVKNKVKDLAKSILDGMKNVLGIQSPSKVFRDEVGKNIALGVGEGMISTLSQVYDEMRNTIDRETNSLGKEMTATGNVSIERNASVTSLLNGIVNQDSTFTSNVLIDSKIVATAVNKVNKRNSFAKGIA